MQTDRIITLDLSQISRLKRLLTITIPPCDSCVKLMLYFRRYLDRAVEVRKINCLRNVISSKSITLYWLICYFSKLLYLVGLDINLCRPLLNLDKKKENWSLRRPQQLGIVFKPVFEIIRTKPRDAHYSYL